MAADLLTLPYLQRGVAEVLALSLAAGLLGTWIVLRGLAFFAHAVATATFPGLVLADGLGFAAPLGAAGAAALFSLALTPELASPGRRRWARRRYRAGPRRSPRGRGDPRLRRLPLRPPASTRCSSGAS